MVTSDYPVKGSSLEELKNAQEARDYTALGARRAGLPSVYLDLVEKATQYDPKNRFSRAAHVVEALENHVTADDKKQSE